MRDEKKNRQKIITGYISKATYCVEIIMGCIVMAVILILTVRMIWNLPHTITDIQNGGFTEFLADILTLVVGLEFIKMLCMHTADTVIEVLMFATARQMIVEHLGAVETLIGIITIGILFAIRKFLLTEAQEKKAEEQQLENAEQRD